jgi:hypothetical protein
MPTLREIVDELADDIGKWNDEGIKEQLKASFKHHAATYIKQTVDKQRSLDKEFELHLPCVSTERVDRAICCDIDSKCDILRTEKLPDPIRFKFFSGITYIGSIDGKLPYPLIEPSRAPFIGFEKWTGHLPRAYWIDNRIYFTNVPSVLEKVNIRMVPEDPEKAGELVGCPNDPDPCFTIDDEYPAPNDIINRTITGMLNGKLSLYLQPPMNRDNEINQENIPSQGQE